MTTLRKAARQALEALEYAQQGRECPSTTRQAITALRAALAQQDAPVARECSDPMCACRGGPCAECEEGEREKEIEDLRSSLYFYQRRCEALQSWQSKMRDPERTIVCDILANGKTLDPAFAGDRYTAPPQQAEPVQEPVAHRVVAGALFDFMGWLTTRRERLVLSSTDDAAPAADAVKDFAEMRGLSMNDAQVKEWQHNVTAPPQRKPLTEEEIDNICRQAHGGADPQEWARNFARAIERAHGIGEQP